MIGVFLNPLSDCWMGNNARASSPSPCNLHRYLIENHDPILQQELGLWKRLSRAFHWKSELAQKIIALSHEIICSQKVVEQEHWADYKAILVESILSKEYAQLRFFLRAIVNQLDAKKRSDLFVSGTDKCFEGKSEELCARFFDLVTADELREMIHSNESFQDHDLDPALAERIAEYAEDVKFLLEDSRLKEELKKSPYYIVSLFHNLISTLLSAFSFFEIGREPASSFDAHNMLQVYYVLCKIPFSIVNHLVQLYYNIMTAITVTGVGLLALASLMTVYLKNFKPPPEKVGEWETFTSEEELENSDYSVLVDSDEVQEVNSRSGCRRAFLITGESGVGKTTCLRLLKRKGCFDGNKRLPMYGINAGDLFTKKEFNGDTELKKMLDVAKNFDVVAIVEGFSALYKQDPSNREIMLEALQKKRIQWILVTTTAEYEKHIKSDVEMFGRLYRISIEKADQKKTLSILENYVRLRAPDLCLGGGVFKEVANQIDQQSTINLLKQLSMLPSTEKIAQPNLSIQVLSAALSQIDKGLSEPDELRKTRAELRHHKLSYVHSHDLQIGSKKNKEAYAAKKSCEERVRQLEREYLEDVEKINQLKAIKKKQIVWESTLLKLALEIKREAGKDPLKSDYKNKMLLFLQYYIQTYLKEKEIKQLQLLRSGDRKTTLSYCLDAECLNQAYERVMHSSQEK